MVAVMLQVPVPAVTDTEPDGLTVQAVDEPSLQVTEPPVVPPVVDSDTVAPYAPLEVPVTVSADWDAFAAVMLVDVDVES